MGVEATPRTVWRMPTCLSRHMAGTAGAFLVGGAGFPRCSALFRGELSVRALTVRVTVDGPASTTGQASAWPGRPRGG